LGWEDGIKVNLTEIVYEGGDWNEQAEEGSQWQASVNMVMDHWVGSLLTN
jgi:hypothetical protein